MSCEVPLHTSGSDLGVDEVQRFELRQREQMLQPGVGDFGVSKFQPIQVRQPFHVSHPGRRVSRDTIREQGMPHPFHSMLVVNTLLGAFVELALYGATGVQHAKPTAQDNSQA